MDGMMEKMGAPKPKEMYPRLMELPNLPMEERAKIEAEAHQRMTAGATLLSQGLDALTNSATTDDFRSMQAATMQMREGLSQFESGLAAHRAIAEGKAPRNVALQWFKREMNLLPPASVAQSGLRIFGMTPFHTAVMGLLIAFAVVMLWMYYFKMRRASLLLERLATEGAAEAIGQPSKATAPKSAAAVVQRATTPANPVLEGKTNATETSASCCDDTNSECADACSEEGDVDISKGLLPVAKRKLCKLRVSKIFQETADVKTFRLVSCHGGSIPFSYLPGQFLTLTLPTDEKPIRRSYTISSSPTQGYYCEITVKREEHGAGSRYLHDVVKEGDRLDVQAPGGKFVFTGREAESIVLIGGGVGITPMMSITRALVDMGWKGNIYFIAACRDPEHFIFEDELRRLCQRHANLHLLVAMSRIDEDTNGYYRGRLSKELLQKWVPNIESTWVHLCGAPPMMDATKQMLSELGVPAEQIHTENFGSQQKPRARTAAIKEAVSQTAVTTAAAKVTFQTSGKTTEFFPDETILEAAERVDVDIDNSCRTGMCGVCAVKVLSGGVKMEIDDGLDPDDRAAGKVLACQATCEADVVIEA